ncbi:MAG: AI-2E family transporter [Lachnospiraceae bacterium]|nr:AI-2E family transporter [Lachnospiraceae bacterium]
MDQKRKIDKKYIYIAVTLFAAIAASIAFFFIIYNAKDTDLGLSKLISAIKPFIYGAIIAYILVPMCNFYEKCFDFLTTCLKLDKQRIHGVCVFLSIILSFCTASLIIYILISLIIPQLIVSLTTIAGNLDSYYQTIIVWIEDLFKNNEFLKKYFEIISLELSSNLTDLIQTKILPSATTFISSFSSGVITAVSFLTDLFIGIIVSVYILNSRVKFSAQARIFMHCIMKEKFADKIIKEVRYANKMFLGFITGSIVDSAIIGIICFIGTSILGMPYALLVSVIVGVTNIIPFFGPFIGGIPAAFLILMVDPIKCIWFVIFIFILQQADGNIIKPLILGERTNLNSFWVLFAILLFSGLYGFAGMIFGVPLFAVIYHLLQELIMKGMKKRNYVPTPEDAELSLLNEYLEKQNEEFSDKEKSSGGIINSIIGIFKKKNKDSDSE